MMFVFAGYYADVISPSSEWGHGICSCESWATLIHSLLGGGVSYIMASKNVFTLSLVWFPIPHSVLISCLIWGSRLSMWARISPMVRVLTYEARFVIRPPQGWSSIIISTLSGRMSFSVT